MELNYYKRRVCARQTGFTRHQAFDAGCDPVQIPAVSNLKPDARLEVADSAGRAGMSLPAVAVVV